MFTVAFGDDDGTSGDTDQDDATATNAPTLSMGHRRQGAGHRRQEAMARDDKTSDSDEATLSDDGRPTEHRPDVDAWSLGSGVRHAATAGEEREEVDAWVELFDRQSPSILVATSATQDVATPSREEDAVLASVVKVFRRIVGADRARVLYLPRNASPLDKGTRGTSDEGTRGASDEGTCRVSDERFGRVVDDDELAGVYSEQHRRIWAAHALARERCSKRSEDRKGEERPGTFRSLVRDVYRELNLPLLLVVDYSVSQNAFTFLTAGSNNSGTERPSGNAGPPLGRGAGLVPEEVSRWQAFWRSRVISALVHNHRAYRVTLVLRTNAYRCLPTTFRDEFDWYVVCRSTFPVYRNHVPAFADAGLHTVLNRDTTGSWIALCPSAARVLFMPTTPKPPTSPRLSSKPTTTAGTPTPSSSASSSARVLLMSPKPPASPRLSSKPTTAGTPTTASSPSSTRLSRTEGGSSGPVTSPPVPESASVPRVPSLAIPTTRTLVETPAVSATRKRTGWLRWVLSIFCCRFTRSSPVCIDLHE
jgi:hypothetical protein